MTSRKPTQRFLQTFLKTSLRNMAYTPGKLIRAFTQLVYRCLFWKRILQRHMLVRERSRKQPLWYQLDWSCYLLAFRSISYVSSKIISWCLKNKSLEKKFLMKILKIRNNFSIGGDHILFISDVERLFRVGALAI